MDVLRVVRLCVVCSFVLFAGNKKPVKKEVQKIYCTNIVDVVKGNQ